MTGALLAGAAVGLGLYALVRALFPARPGLAAGLAAFDRARAADTAGKQNRAAPGVEQVSGLRAQVGRSVARLYESRGWEQRSVRADLALLGRSYEGFLATKFLLPSAALIFLPALVAYTALLDVGGGLALPTWMAVLFAAFFFVLPDIQLRQEAAQRRRDFRHVVGAFLDLVSMNLAGGRGVPEALMSAAQVGDGWAMVRIRDSLANARITGQTPWQALGRLGEDVNIGELRDLAAALTLVADDGAKVRQSLTARAASMRARELSDLEGKAGERSQSMLVAQLLFCFGFMVFLGFPALVRVLTA
ncbi:type II secretion system F family protein [Thermomonospora umbrina]|uniref:Type II secretion system (T2SS) protein F n=1 Tax=Thermomonospora umbrina TaxID=111806 RepID=A0A3D9SWB7_9ACTN|nr:type II secretion system F family protein [Thermomonospora umbrina]REE98313.1 type II secretion system (T2SS) protein F [Thermomonospora umbrina]